MSSTFYACRRGAVSKLIGDTPVFTFLVCPPAAFDLPYHVTQRGNGRQKVFFSDEDYEAYRDLLAAAAREARVGVWAWCLMPNHVHLILCPSDEDGLRRTLARAHRAYAGRIHARRRRTGHFWQGRFGAVAMDEDHLVAAWRYVALNPVRARLVRRAEDWRPRREAERMNALSP